MLTPRPYQEDAIAAVNAALAERSDNPAIVLPTGSGKSLVMALMIHRWIEKCPQMRIMVLAHRKELVEQNALELQSVDASLSIGVFSASLKRRETLHSITFASIDSVSKKAGDFPPQDVLLIDEAHRIPVRGEGKYRRFIDAMKARTPDLRIVGLTATPYRLGSGPICHKDHILNHICHESNVGDLIRQGYLSNIRTVQGEHSNLDLTGVKKTAGEYNLKELSVRVDQTDVISQAVQDLVLKVRYEKRNSTIVFCIDTEHCKHVKNELRKYGIDAPYILGTTAIKERDKIVESFRAGYLHWMLSVNCFGEGLNVKRIDCVGMLRPTQSKGLWVQAVGRGLRLFEGKKDCLILDYGDNITRHGPIDYNDSGEVKLATCDECSNVFSRVIKVCPSCGWEIPSRQIQMFEAEGEREKIMHAAKSKSGMLLNEPKWAAVDGVRLRLHKKAGKPDSVLIEFHCGMMLARHWLCLDHDGYGSVQAYRWLCNMSLPVYDSASDMLSKCDGALIMKSVKKILVRYEGKYLKIAAYGVERNGSILII
tara:strand:+ start:23241 stop:24854 length:1614 start_codon:yes stop_codon:yes gene_type:complete